MFRVLDWSWARELVVHGWGIQFGQALLLVRSIHRMGSIRTERAEAKLRIRRFFRLAKDLDALEEIEELARGEVRFGITLRLALAATLFASAAVVVGGASGFCHF